jgi:hypothetical protein
MFLTGKSRQQHQHSLYAGMSLSYLALPEYMAGNDWMDVTQSLPARKNVTSPATNTPKEAGWSLGGNFTPPRFTGGAPCVYNINNTASFFSTTGLTISAWVCADIVTGNRTIFGWRPVGTAQIVRLYCAGTSLHLHIKGNTTTVDQADSVFTLAANKWNHLAGTWDGSTIRLYVNGQAGSTGALSDTLIQPTQMQIGGQGDSFDFFDGVIAEVTMWKRALSLTEIFHHFQIGRHGHDLLITEAPIYFIPAGGSVYNDNLDIDGIADIDLDVIGSYNHTLTVAGTADIDVSIENGILISLTVAGNAALTGLPGIVYTDGVGLESFSSLARLDGFLYPESLTVAGISNIAVAELYLQQEILTIAGISNVTLANLMSMVENQIVAGIADIDIDSNHVSGLTLTIPGLSTIFVENYYDVFYGCNAIGAFAGVLAYIPGGSQNPTTVSAFSIANQLVFARTVTDSFTMTEVIRGLRSQNTLLESLALTDSATATRINNNVVTDTYTLTDTAVGYRAFTDTYTMTDLVSVIKVKYLTVSDSLTLADSATRTVIYNLGVQDTLVINTTFETETSIVGFTIEQNDAHIVVKPNKCLVILSAGNQTIVLPCPIFGNFQAFQGELALKRTMTGVTYTYVKQTKLEKLEYPFQLWTNKYLELRTFLRNYGHEIIRLNNWKGELWYVHLVNNPAEFTAAARIQPRGERYDITLQFEGVRIGG